MAALGGTKACLTAALGVVFFFLVCSFFFRNCALVVALGTGSSSFLNAMKEHSGGGPGGASGVT